MERNPSVNGVHPIDLIDREIAVLKKRLGGLMPEAQRAQIAQRLFDLEERRRALPISAPGKVVRLWTPEGERPVE